ncbi:hypothetical protein [Embleya sp. NPDC020886]
MESASSLEKVLFPGLSGVFLSSVDTERRCAQSGGASGGRRRELPGL